MRCNEMRCNEMRCNVIKWFNPLLTPFQGSINPLLKYCLIKKNQKFTQNLKKLLTK